MERNQKDGQGWELTWRLMEHWIRSIYQPASVRDGPASIATAHNRLPWINNGRSVGVRGHPLHWPQPKEDPLSLSCRECQLNDELFLLGWWGFFMKKKRKEKKWQLQHVQRVKRGWLLHKCFHFNLKALVPTHRGNENEYLVSDVHSVEEMNALNRRHILINVRLSELMSDRYRQKNILLILILMNMNT